MNISISHAALKAIEANGGIVSAEGEINLPDGTTSSMLPAELEAGNIEAGATFQLPDGTILMVNSIPIEFTSYLFLDTVKPVRVSFKVGNEESKAVLDLKGIPWSEADGFSVEFPTSVQISSDQDEHSQPSYWVYQVDQEKFVYDLRQECLVVE